MTSATDDFLKTIADARRRQLIISLTHSDYRVHELVRLLDQPQNLVSYHLKKLREIHLVREHRSAADARDIYYSLDLETLHTLYRSAGAAIHPALAAESTDNRNSAADPLRVLFLCTGNSARSQIAEGLLRESGGASVAVFSAGTAPDGVHPYAVRVMDELNIDIRGQLSKGLDALPGWSFDYVITLCDRAREACPILPESAQFIHWSIPDPKTVKEPEAQYRAFQQTADELRTRIRYFLAALRSQQKAA